MGIEIFAPFLSSLMPEKGEAPEKPAGEYEEKPKAKDSFVDVTQAPAKDSERMFLWFPYSCKHLGRMGLHGFVFMLGLCIIMIALQKLADSLKGEEHERIFLVNVLSHALFLFGSCLLAFGLQLILTKIRPYRIGGAIMIAMGVAMLFTDFYWS